MTATVSARRLHDSMMCSFSFLLLSWEQQSAGGTRLGSRCSLRLVLQQLCWTIMGNLRRATHGFLTSFPLSWATLDGEQKSFISSRVWTSVPLSLGSSNLGKLLLKQLQSYLSKVFFSSCCGLLLVRRLKAALAQVGIAVGRCFQTKLQLGDQCTWQQELINCGHWDTTFCLELEALLKRLIETSGWESLQRCHCNFFLVVERMILI